jgi:hypothetical protein
MIVWELTEQQTEQVVQLFDIATKAGGLQVAKGTVLLMDSLMAAIEKSKETESDSPQAQ